MSFQLEVKSQWRPACLHTEYILATQNKLFYTVEEIKCVKTRNFPTFTRLWSYINHRVLVSRVKIAPLIAGIYSGLPLFMIYSRSQEIIYFICSFSWLS